MPEEVTTINLVRRLALLGRRLGVTAVLHSRSLEGRYTLSPSGGRLPASGADLELNVEIARGQWLDLLLQAKRLYPRVNSQAQYDQWDNTQASQLTAWAWKHGNRVPGMLLYNGLCRPFVKNKLPSNYSDFKCEAFEACRGANHLQLHDYREMISRGLDLFEGTPGGVSLVLDAIVLGLASKPTANSLKAVHSPLEHLAHHSHCAGNGSSSHPFGGTGGRGSGGVRSLGSEDGRTEAGNGADEPVGSSQMLNLPGARPTDSIDFKWDGSVVKTDRSDWAVRLEELSRAGAMNEYRSPSESEEFPIVASVIIPFVETNLEGAF